MQGLSIPWASFRFLLIHGGQVRVTYVNPYIFWLLDVRQSLAISRWVVNHHVRFQPSHGLVILQDMWGILIWSDPSESLLTRVAWTFHQVQPCCVFSAWVSQLRLALHLPNSEDRLYLTGLKPSVMHRVLRLCLCRKDYLASVTRSIGHSWWLPFCL